MGALPTMAGSRISARVQTVSFNNTLVSLLVASMRWLIVSVNVLPVPEADGMRGMRLKSKRIETTENTFKDSKKAENLWNMYTYYQTYILRMYVKECARI